MGWKIRKDAKDKIREGMPDYELEIEDEVNFYYSSSGVDDSSSLILITSDMDAINLVHFLDGNRMVGVFVEHPKYNEPSQSISLQSESIGEQCRDFPSVHEGLEFVGDGNDEINLGDDVEIGGNSVNIDERGEWRATEDLGSGCGTEGDKMMASGGLGTSDGDGGDKTRSNMGLGTIVRVEGNDMQAVIKGTDSGDSDSDSDDEQSKDLDSELSNMINSEQEFSEDDDDLYELNKDSDVE
ncbi:hypothetical protein CDL12_01606 [Handroanthus impetiginosus]|uniref:Uncharacterized protein n=1 Tax=Handroanthus impetiginosus TaxID=429701 RepID=A0A2G9I7C6_9LAMI|nr:hypothetical protein CDL12_01606 [Handroanthus impetiginosus]